MFERFFKLLYVFALVSLGIFFIVFNLKTIEFDKIVISTYRAKCLSNNEYVVLQGSGYKEYYTFSEIILDSEALYDLDTKQTLNLYCKYYDEIQPHIAAYINSNTSFEKRLANIKFFEFRDSVASNVSSYPATFQIEEVSRETQWFQLYGPIVDSLTIIFLGFIILQILKISYVYIVFGKIVWHPFRNK